MSSTASDAGTAPSSPCAKLTMRLARYTSAMPNAIIAVRPPMTTPCTSTPIGAGQSVCCSHQNPMTPAAAVAAVRSRGSSSTATPRRVGAGANSCIVMSRSARRRVVRRPVLGRVVLVDRDGAVLDEPRHLGRVLTGEVALPAVHIAVQPNALLAGLVLATRVGIPPDVGDVVGAGVVVA